MAALLIVGRTRSIYGVWHRDPNGPILKKPPPVGKRTPNGLMWGDNWDSFFFGEVMPGKNLVTIWSRTMIQEYGENYYRIADLEGPESNPRVIPPYPLLDVVDETQDFAEEAQDVVEEDWDLTMKTQDAAPGQASSPKKRKKRKKRKGKKKSKSQSISINDLPKLEEFIPKEFFPDVLIVHDANDLTSGLTNRSDSQQDQGRDTCTQYRRVWPTNDSEIFKPSQAIIGKKFAHQVSEEDDVYIFGSGSPFTSGPGTATASCAANSTPTEPRVAHLHFNVSTRLGQGHHSVVYRAALTLPFPLAANSPTGQVAVAAKLAYPVTRAREMLRNEGDIYNKFPRHLMEDWSGLNVVPSHKFPVPVDAVVPKFYGYYEPVDGVLPSSRPGRSPILLMEECGVELKTHKLNLDQQSQCYTHLLRLHSAQFIHDSTYTRNIMVQPGPLRYEPSARTLEQPSFRVIDFGRSEHFKDWFRRNHGKDPSEVPEEEKEQMTAGWRNRITFQEKVARDTLGVDLGDV